MVSCLQALAHKFTGGGRIVLLINEAEGGGGSGDDVLCMRVPSHSQIILGLACYKSAGLCKYEIMQIDIGGFPIL